MTVRVRVIPCLDVRDGRVVKGVNFVDLRDAGDPVEQARAYDAAGRTSCASSTFPPAMKGAARCSTWCAHGRGVLHAADRGRGRAQRRGCARAAAGRGGQGGGQFRRRQPAGSGGDIAQSSAASASWLGRRAARGAGPWEIFTHGGRKPTGIDALDHAVRLAELGAGELLVTSMDGDGTQGYDLELTRAIADAVSVPVVASGGVGALTIWSPA
jgi:cyclase